MAQYISRPTWGFDLGCLPLSVATSHVVSASVLLRVLYGKKCMWTACGECLGEGNAPPLELFRELCLSQHPEQNGESTRAVAPCCLLARQPWFWPCCGLKDTNLRRNLFIMWGIHAILDSIQWARWMICQIGPSHGWIRANLQYNSFAASDTKITFAGFYIQLSDDLEVSREKKSDL